MESKKINQLATELAPDLSDLTIIGDPTTGISKKITLSQMASLFTGTVEEYATLAAFPLVGVADTIYIALDTNIIYRYDTSLSAYVILSPNVINSLVFSDANGFDGTITLVGSVATLSITTALTLGSVPFIGASGALIQDNSNLFFDDTNNRLGINTNAPTTALDVFGSGIIGRLNGTSTNNAYLGFSSAGTNKWSIGNVQSDHRFRIFSEANTSELVSVLQTGEFGIGIANPTTKFHIDGAASALIANLDANVSVAKSISFRSDNSARINLEVSGSENGANTGAKFQIKRFSDAGVFIDTPFEISRETGKSFFYSDRLFLAKNQNGFTSFYIENVTGGTSSGGSYLINSDFGSGVGEFGKFSTLTTAQGIISPKDAFIKTEFGSIALVTNDATGTIKMAAGNSATAHLTIGSTGAATFSSSVTSDDLILTAGTLFGAGNTGFSNRASDTTLYLQMPATGFNITDNALNTKFIFSSTGAATFSGIITSTQGNNGTLLQATSATTGWVHMIRATNTGQDVTMFIENSTGGDRAIGTLPYAAGLCTYTNTALQFGTNNNIRMTITSAGNVGIGVTPAAWASPTAGKVIQIGNTASIFSYNNLTTDLASNIYFNGSDYLYLQTGAASLYRQQSGEHAWFTVGSGTGGTSAGISERMRIESGGRINIGTTTNNGLLVFPRTTNNAYIGTFDNDTIIIATLLTGSGRLKVESLGTGAVSATAGVLSTTSDMNLKIEDGFIDNALDKVLKLTPRYFLWKEESGLPTDLRQLGFYAQEVNEALGEEVANTPKDEDGKWGIYDRGMIAMLTKAIQEQNQTIQSLQEQINILSK